MRLVITGFSGFVSRHFLDLLSLEEPGSEVLGIDKNAPSFTSGDYPLLRIRFNSIDLTQKEAVDKLLTEFAPDYILHLAAVSSVAKSWSHPAATFENNTALFLNLAEYLRLKNNNCRLLSVGSSEVYGPVDESMLPLTEQHPLHPLNPYAAARASQETLSRIYAESYGLSIVMTRSFNHIGPGQKEPFVIASFAKQMAIHAKQHNNPATIITGDLDVIRDFLDVRDVVKGYLLLLKKGKSGEVYNICSGNGVSLREIINEMAAQLHLQINTETDPARVRPNENRRIIGSNQKINNEFGWTSQIPFKQSLTDILAWWQQQL